MDFTAYSLSSSTKVHHQYPTELQNVSGAVLFLHFLFSIRICIGWFPVYDQDFTAHDGHFLCMTRTGLEAKADHPLSASEWQ